MVVRGQLPSRVQRLAANRMRRRQRVCGQQRRLPQALGLPQHAGSCTCSTCPKDFAGDGYIGCFDVNECPAGDCSDRIPVGADKAAPPVVTTSGDVTVAATSEAGAVASFTASAKDPVEGAKQAYCFPRSGSTFAIGTTTVSCWAVNKVGKMGRATLTVTVNRPQF